MSADTPDYAHYVPLVMIDGVRDHIYEYIIATNNPLGNYRDFIILSRVCRGFRESAIDYTYKHYQKHITRLPFPSLMFFGFYPDFKKNLTPKELFYQLTIRTPYTAKRHIYIPTYTIMRRDSIPEEFPAVLHLNPLIAINTNNNNAKYVLDKAMTAKKHRYPYLCHHTSMIKMSSMWEWNLLKMRHDELLQRHHYYINDMGPFCSDAVNPRKYMKAKDRKSCYWEFVYADCHNKKRITQTYTLTKSIKTGQVKLTEVDGETIREIDNIHSINNSIIGRAVKHLREIAAKGSDYLHVISASRYSYGVVVERLENWGLYGAYGLRGSGHTFVTDFICCKPLVIIRRENNCFVTATVQ